MNIYRFYFILVLATLVLCSCSFNEAIPGRDKQGAGLLSGAAFGAGSGAITGAQVGAPGGPAALVGAGFGAVWGALQGMGLDALEEEDLRLMAEVDYLSEEAWVQYSLIEHFERKRELFPERDIFPADAFFDKGDVELSDRGRRLAQVFVDLLTEKRHSSRILIDAYHLSKAKTEEEKRYAQYLGEKRTQEIARALVKSGIEPRRIQIRSILLGSPLVIDPYDLKARYNQAIEFSLLDI